MGNIVERIREKLTPKNLTIAGVIAGIFWCFTHVDDLPKAWNGAQLAATWVRYSYLHVPFVARFRAHRLLESIEAPQKVCLEQARAFALWTDVPDSMLVQWHYPDGDGGCSSGPDFSKIGVVNGNSWHLRYLDNDYREEGSVLEVSILGQWVFEKGGAGNLVGVKIAHFDGKALNFKKLPANIPPMETRKTRLREDGGLDIWTLGGLAHGTPGSDSFTVVNPETYAYGNRSHYVTATRNGDAFILRDKDTVLPGDSEDQNAATVSPTFLLPIEKGDRIYVPANCESSGLKDSENFLGAQIVDPEFKDTPELTCYDDEQDSHDSNEAAAFSIKVKSP